MAVNANIALISLDDAEDLLKISNSNATETEILEALIDQVSAMINRYCGRQFISRSWTEYYNGRGQAELILRNFPIVSITSLYNSTNLREWTSTYLVDVSANVLVKKDQGIIRLWNNEHSFLSGEENIKIVYTAGYAVADVPQDLKFAARKWVAKLYKDYNAGIHNIQSQTIGENTTTYSVVKVPDEVKGHLDRFKVRSYCPDFSYSDDVGY